VSVPDIRPNLQNTSAFYLAHIYQQSSTQPNGSRPSIPSSLSDPTEPFSPPTSSVWVNGLWFSSLVISLSCALLATLIQRWARRYERVAYPRYGPHKRARIRAFYKDGVEKWRIPKAVEVLPLLLHISLFVFFAGLSVFLFGVHRTIFKTVTALISLCVISYACLSLFPVIHKNSLYSTPLSVPSSFIFTGIRFLLFWMFPCFGKFIRNFRNFIHNFIHNFGKFIREQLLSRDPEVHDNFFSRSMAKTADNFFSRSLAKTAEEFALNLNRDIGGDIDRRSLLWTFESLDEDTDLEEFFEGLPRLCDSDIGKELELKEKFIDRNKEKLSNALIGLMNRTLISNLVKDFVKQRRMIVFTKVIESESISLLDPLVVLRRVLFENWHGLLECVEFGLSMQHWTITSNDDRVTFFYARCVAAFIISMVQHRDKRWIQLATVSAPPLSGSLHHNEDHHHSILLANAIHVARMAIETYSSEDTHRNDILDASRKTLGALCKLDIRLTLHGLQHEFCDLWNKLVRMAQTDQVPHHRSVSVKLLRNFRKLYITLHGTPRTNLNTADDWEQVLDNPDFYHECTEDNHRTSLSFPDLQLNVPCARSDGPAPSGMQFPEPHSPPHPVPSSPPSSPDQPSPSFPVPNPYSPPIDPPPPPNVPHRCNVQ
jgi:hypothetical protein